MFNYFIYFSDPFKTKFLIIYRNQPKELVGYYVMDT